MDLSVVFSAKRDKLNYRSKLVDWMKTIAVKLKLSTVTVHLGIFLLDKFMDNHNIKESRLAAVCMVCLILAAKFEELENRVPKLADVTSLLNNTVTSSDLVHLESFILQSFSWRVSWPTVAHFAEYYSLFAVVAGDTDPSKLTHDHLTDLVRGSMKDFMDLCLSDIYMLDFLSSEVAASCLLAARLEHGVRPLWPLVISKLTGYGILHLQPCLDLIVNLDMGYGHKRKAEDTIESGYDSSSSPDNSQSKKRAT